MFYHSDQLHLGASAGISKYYWPNHFRDKNLFIINLVGIVFTLHTPFGNSSSFGFIYCYTERISVDLIRYEMKISASINF